MWRLAASNWPSGYGGSISGVIYANGSFVAAADEGIILTSPDGMTWTMRQKKARKDLWSVSYGAGTYVIVGLNGTILQSDSAIPASLAGRYLANQGYEVSLTVEVGRSYRLQTASNLVSAPWDDLVTLTNTFPTNQFTDASATNFSKRYYRAVTP